MAKKTTGKPEPPKPMEITVQNSHLTAAAAACMPATGKANTVPWLEYLRLEAAEDRTTLTATDLEVALQRELDASVAAPGVVLIPGKTALGLLRALPADAEVKVTAGAGTVTLAAERNESRLRTLHPDDFAVTPDPPSQLPEVFRGIGPRPH